MKTKKILVLLLTIVMVTAVGLTGCKKDPAETVKKDADQFLSTVLFEQRTLDVSEATDADSIEILTETMEGLGRVTNDGTGDKIEPGLAEDWKISEDGLVYTFKLRDANWTDGKPVTAQNFVDSWLRLLDPEKGFGYAYFAYDVKNGKQYNSGEAKKEDVGLKAVDDKTFEVTLERPTPYFINKIGFMSLFPIRIDEVEAQGETYGTDYTKMSFCGPFKITEYISNNKIALEKNEKYWDAAKVQLKKINMQAITETSTQMQMFESKQLDITGATGDYLKQYKERAKNGDFKYDTNPLPSTDYLTFNMVNNGTCGLVNNQKIRQAIAYIFNREDIVDKVYGRYIPAYGLVPYKISVGEKEFRKETEEPLKVSMKNYDTQDKINALFKEGLRELGKDENAKYKMILLTSGTSATSKSRQEYYMNAIEQIKNIDVELIVTADTNQFWEVKDSFEGYDFVISGWNGDYNDPMTFLDMWVTGGGNNDAGYKSEAYDKLMNNDILVENDNAKRLAIYAEAEKLILNDMPIAPLFYEDTNRFRHNYVKDVQFPLFGASYEMKYAYTQGR